MSTVSDVAQRYRDSRLQSVLEENRSAALVLPGLLLWSMFMVLPLGYVIVLSMTDANNINLFQPGWDFLGLPMGQAEVIWLENYQQLFLSQQSLDQGFFDVLLSSNPLDAFNYRFWNSLLITMLFVVVSVTGKVVLGIAIAMIMTGNRVRGKRILRGVIIMPMGIPVIFSIIVWRSVFSTARFGLLNQILFELNVISEPVQWLNRQWLSFAGYVVTEMWLAYPFMVLITVSALQNVNGDLLDAAKVDGAGFFSRFWHVILPSIKRPVMFGTILTSAASFQQVLIPWVFHTGDVPIENQFILVYAYAEAFAAGNQKLGEGSAISIAAIFFIGIFMWIAVKKGNLAEEAGE